MDRGLFIFMIDGLLTNGLIQGMIALASDMLVVRFEFSESQAGTFAMLPYFVFALTIPIVVGYVESLGNRMHLIFLMGILNMSAFSIWTVLPPCYQCWWSIMPLILLGVSLSIYITIMQCSIPFVIKSHLLGTALGLQGVFQNFGLMLFTFVFSYIHDNTLTVSQGYFWSIVFFLLMSIVSFLTKCVLHAWDLKRGSILNSKTPYLDFLQYSQIHPLQHRCLDEEQEDYRAIP